VDIEEILLEHLVVKARIFFYFLFFIFTVVNLSYLVTEEEMVGLFREWGSKD
jgi:hypothetical protein